LPRHLQESQRFFFEKKKQKTFIHWVRSMIPATEGSSARYEALEAWSTIEALEAMWEGQMAAVAAIRPVLPAIAAAVAEAAERLSRGGRLIYVGAGTSGRIGAQDGSELPPTFDWPSDRLVLLMAGGADAFTRSIENAEDDTAAAAAAIAAHAVGPDDVVIGIAASGTTPYTLAAIAAAAARGALTIAVANSAGTPLPDAAAHALVVATGAEAVAGSTRMKAGTAQKVVLNLLSTAMMLRLGRVYRGRMVDMIARNDKLRRRGVRMLQDLTGCDEDAARAALQTAGGKVKLAILVLDGATREQAEARLAAHGGDLRRALAGAPA
jgi:N-acetylmuramic acid 6-phosphate etherase